MKRLKTGLQVIAFNVDTWLEEMLSLSSPHVDCIYMAYPSRPWGYNTKARESQRNPTIIDEDKLCRKIPNLKIVRGDWLYDEDTRNGLLKKAREDGCSWCFVQDADEFYTIEGWKKLKSDLELAQSKGFSLVTTRWLNFWKSSDYVIRYPNGGIFDRNVCAAVRCEKEDIYFKSSRSTSCQTEYKSDAICYHFANLVDDERMKLKLDTWTHSNEVDKLSWFKYKWQRWDEKKRFLHPGNPVAWWKAVPFYELPEEFDHLSFVQNTKQPILYKDCSISLREYIYDLKSVAKYYLGRIKTLVRKIFRSR